MHCDFRRGDVNFKTPREKRMFFDFLSFVVLFLSRSGAVHEKNNVFII